MEFTPAIASSKSSGKVIKTKVELVKPPKPAMVKVDAIPAVVPDTTVEKPAFKRRKITEKQIIPIKQSSSLNDVTPAIISDWKIGYDRHMYLVQYVNNNVKFFIGEVMPSPGYNRSSKTIELSIDQLKVLYGMVLSGMTMARIGFPTPNTDHLTSMLPLGDDIYFVWSRFKKQEVATIRRFVKKANDHVIALPSGFTFVQKYYDAISDVFRSMVIFFLFQNLIKIT